MQAPSKLVKLSGADCSNLACMPLVMQVTVGCNSVPAEIYANMLLGNPTAVSKYFGTAMYSVTNIIFITESLSTLDSTFTSAAKLLGPEFLGILETGQPQPPQTATKRSAAHVWLWLRPVA
jgi:hypothetical protein